MDIFADIVDAQTLVTISTKNSTIHTWQGPKYTSITLFMLEYLLKIPYFMIHPLYWIYQPFEEMYIEKILLQENVRGRPLALPS